MSNDPLETSVEDDLAHWQQLCGAPLTQVPYEVWLADPDGNYIEDPGSARVALDRLVGPDPQRQVEAYVGGAVLATLPQDVIEALHEHRSYDHAADGYSITIELP